MDKKITFTLVEVLIVIGVIGIVAALTIPALINTISAKAKQAQTDVIETRLLDGLNRFSATDDGLSQNYETTYDFLQGLSKHYKMSQICKADEITKCFPYSKIYSQDGSKSADVKSLKTIYQFISGDGAKDYLAPASFISAQGTPFVMALKKDCIWDMGQAMQSIEDSECIAYLYDKNGVALPNKVGSDLIGHGLTINGFPLAILGGVKIMTNAFFPSDPLTSADCSVNKTKYDIIMCRTTDDDYWGGAMKSCKSKGWHLPTEQQLADIANALYTGLAASATDTVNAKIYGTDEAQIGSKEPVPAPLSGLGKSWTNLWSDSDKNDYQVYGRDFISSYSARSNSHRNNSYRSIIRAICVSD